MKNYWRGYFDTQWVPNLWNPEKYTDIYKKQKITDIEGRKPLNSIYGDEARSRSVPVRA